MSIFNAGFIYMVILWLDQWEIKDYIKVCLKFAKFLATHVAKFMTSIVMIAAFIFAVTFKDRIALILGIDHKHLFRCKVRDCLNCWSTARFQPVELFLWKVEDLPSAELFSSNNVFVELFFGYNEPKATRVHNNAGSGCVLKETVQVNFDEEDDEETLFIFVKNQKVMGTTELARAEITTETLKKWVAESKQSGHQTEMFTKGWSDKEHLPITLIPRGKLWMRAVAFQEEETPTC